MDDGSDKRLFVEEGSGKRLIYVDDGLDKRLLKGIGISAAVLLSALAVVIFIINHFIWPHSVLGDQAGTWEGHVYTNTAIRLRLEIPESWTILDVEEQKKVTATALEMDEGDLTGGFLVSALDEATGTSLNLGVEMYKMPPPESVRASLENVAKATTNGTAYEIRQLEDMTVADRPWKAWYIDCPELSAEVYALFREVEDYVVELAVVGFYGSDPVQFLDCVTTLEN